MTQEREDQKTFEFENWLNALLLMLGLSAVVSAICFLSGPVFNLTFEVCIFYLPTLILPVTALRQRIKSGK